ncbi:hypothetical protein [Nonomuraea sp. NEAU-A123]|uniref:hypothetical protein n=1 Tax=Nonomuraea sp. NEAU-A123 TaxID=2839649 RepID=UPI0020328C9B|nr:hypothetical protein [Nonomuraea sp. NEAU-A123]
MVLSDPRGLGAAPGCQLTERGHDGLLAGRCAPPNTHTHRAYASAIDRVTALLGRDRPLAEIGTALAELWGASAPAVWNRT